MKDYAVGHQLILPSEFELSGRFIQPTGPITVEVLGLDGSVFDTYALDLGPTGYAVPLDHLTLEQTDLAKVFFLQIEMVSDSETIKTMVPVRIVRFKPITVSAEQIRQALGANFEEIPDSSLDIYGAYLELSATLSEDLFSDITRMSKANRLIQLHVMLKQLPTLPIKLLNSRSVDDHKFTRNKIDFEMLKGQLQAEYDSLIYTDFGLTSDLIEEPLLTVVTLTDPFLGT